MRCSGAPANRIRICFISLKRTTQSNIKLKDEKADASSSYGSAAARRARRQSFRAVSMSTGEPIEWEKAGEPSVVPCAPLERVVRSIAVASLLLRHWPNKGTRHDLALCVGGFLARVGRQAAIARFVEIVAREFGAMNSRITARLLPTRHQLLCAVSQPGDYQSCRSCLEKRSPTQSPKFLIITSLPRSSLVRCRLNTFAPTCPCIRTFTRLRGDVARH